jgi:hypothetical protein
MKKFLIRSSCFIIPFMLLHLFTLRYYSPDKGDLLRLGCIINSYPEYRKIFSKEFENEITYTQFSDNPSQRNFKALIVGDSFSEQRGFGYINYLAQNKNISILHLNGSLIYKNQIQTLYGLLNGDFFEQYHFKYVILQNVERNFVYNCEDTDIKKIITCDELNELAKLKPKKEDLGLNFPSSKTMRLPFYTYRYYTKSTCLLNDMVYKTNISKSMFSVDKKELLFYFDEVKYTELNNNRNNVCALNNILNNLNDLLKKKGITLIVLPSPDKYDIYYDYIIDKTSFPKPMFFETLKTMAKNYRYIDSKELLTSALRQKKDIYFYDDTHWSPWASQIIATEIKKQLGGVDG